MLRQALLRGAQCGRCMAKNASCKSLMNRQFSHLPWFPSFRSSNPFRNLERQIREVEDYFDQAFPMSRGWAGEFCPRRMRDHPVLAEFYRIQNPIVEENGVKKFMLEFDVRRFKPEEVCVKTSAKDSSLIVEAKHSDENSKYEFSRKMELPKGVDPNEIKCRFTAEGVLELEAPYNPPVDAEPAKDTEINVKHE